MDATIYQIIFGELGDLNCSLIDAFQDTFLENASLSLLSADGKMLPFCVKFWEVLGIGGSIRVCLFLLYFFFFFFFLRSILQCHNR